jgi:hypothetical protein
MFINHATLSKMSWPLHCPKSINQSINKSINQYGAYIALKLAAIAVQECFTISLRNSPEKRKRRKCSTICSKM